MTTPSTATGGRGPTIVLVHGGFADGSGWRGVYDLLKQDGHDVRIVQEPNLSHEGDVKATKMITGAERAGRPRRPLLRRGGDNRSG